MLQIEAYIFKGISVYQFPPKLCGSTPHQNIEAKAKSIMIHGAVFTISLVLTALLSCEAAVSRFLKDAPVENGLCDASVKSYSGYFNIVSGVNKNYFYWMFESRSATQATDPLIVWLTGGPGCSSQLALLSENGPCSVTPDGMSTQNNPFSWNSNANIMWVDQPANVGYSYGDKIVDMDHNETMVIYTPWFVMLADDTHAKFL